MPQLLPEPWFLIFFSSWLILLLISPSKIMTYKILNTPNQKFHKKSKSSWLWPWL
uniref:ATP synthase complex subunit 8 n=1 Tax=Cardioglossa leucomystax TaxID=111122 RepID=S4V1K5_9NEOB|nr:ATP synthase F0 subunit 8 [Cardioglossa leucomystax]